MENAALALERYATKRLGTDDFSQTRSCVDSERFRARETMKADPPSQRSDELTVELRWRHGA